MRQLPGSGVILAGATLSLLAVQPVWAAATQVTAVRLNPTNQGLNVILETAAGDRPQIFTSSRGNALVADIINTQLRTPQGNSFRQDNPAPGISSVSLTQLDQNSVRLVVTGTTNAPSSQPAAKTAQGITFSISPASGVPVAQQPPTNQTPAPQQQQQTPANQTPGVLVPNPDVQIQGTPTPQPGTPTPPPFLPRAVAPPVGDIAVSNVDSSAATIDLETAERVPRLVLREAPVREVLALLARAAGLNLAFSAAPAPGTQQAQTEPTPGGEDGPRISLDIENESVQDVFNYVLRISGLQANRTGRTIFVAPRLTNEARNVIVRSLRLNQINVGSALNFLVAMGAESAVSRERVVTSVNAVPVGGSATPVTQTQTSTETRVETQRIDFQDSIPLLRGLQVVGDERTNSVSLIGTPRQVEIATAQLVQVDSRRRQVAVNVKIVDVNLSDANLFNTSFSFGLGDNFFQFNNTGNAVINFGRNNSPAGFNANQLRNFTSRFLAQLETSVENGNAKILTDPTLTVQEGQTAQVNLTTEVPGGIQVQFISPTVGAPAIPVRTVDIREAGLSLAIQITRIDDNGFVNLSVAPSVSAPTNTIDTGDGGLVTFLSTRSFSSGQIRLRDRQTLVISGIIQETDRAQVSKVPILGDIPLLGALFRRTNKTNQRQEVIVLLTPQVLDDSQNATAGYNYTPSPEARQILERQGFQSQ
ncbi:type IV pilus secretin family protein [Gloeocapsopsis dulcis]|uniref:General secretion pathway protein GspD n=1 Tax=Gloeocapsopsis dulcis AAB1 = 1H9 TaxID=1433147 RepID=A0A6N8FQM8_9CHRO|nr:type IV pilus secretin family protein [Gloeocapsopsis dulcis]MUL35249.1 general secretion pathway protein GspD [Gloeocapsopsis dulcis AAB1 = 1H9]WNN89131.1 AMIN domain-containing protein [Gloeocapsopsis dulcis]